MRNIKANFYQWILFFIILTVIPAYAQTDLEQDIPVDPNVRIGKLANGMTYYIRHNEKPEDRVELRLVVNAGSILEEDDQLGLAHFMEHMAFNGTKNFEKNELISYLQSVGVKFGMHLNAYTSFDETVYMLPIPSDSAEVLNTGLQILEDWAHNVTLNEQDIDEERGIVLEEWRTGLGPEQRMQEQYLPVILKNSRYAERLPIGKKAIIESFEYEALKRFYRDWYRPDLMAVVAVGDINVDEMEQKIRQQFANIKAKGNAPERKAYDIPDHQETFVSIVTDPEASFTQIQLLYKQDKVPEKSQEDYRQSLIRSLYTNMINQRLDELQQQANPPFIYGGTGYGGLLARSKDAYQSFAMVGESDVEKGLKALLRENERVRQFGFTQSELDRSIKEYITGYEKAYNERNKTESRVYADEYVRNFLEEEPIPGIEFEYGFVKNYLDKISLTEINQLADQWITRENRVVVITAPEKEETDLPSEQEVKDILDEMEQVEVEPYEDKLVATSLMEQVPQPGQIEASNEIESLNLTELTLSNGVKVILKPTDFKNDQILMRAFSPGGTSLYPDQVYQSARFADNIIQESGVKDFSPTDLQKILAGKIVSVSPYIGTLNEGFAGSTSPKDLESMLQLIYLYFNHPRKDQELFLSFVNKNKAMYKNLLSNPRYFYSDKVSRIMSQNHPRGGGYPTQEDWEDIELDQAFKIYQERFADASDFTFVLVGNFDVSEVSPLLATYLGSLPALDREETWKDLGIRPPEGKVVEKIKKGTEPQSLVTLKFPKKHPYDRKTSYLFSSFSDVLNIKLTEELRESKSGVYSAGSRASANKYPYDHYAFNISFPCAPENVEDLTETTFELIRSIQENGPSEEDVQKVKETQRRIREENLQDNRFWLNALENMYYYGFDPRDILDYQEKVADLSARDIQEVANSLIDLDEYILVVLYPENYQKQ
ncbi:MAG: M16 family metallopeptidase [Candidatus Cyclobacteriaceae bacterium M3_2C_046]